MKNGHAPDKATLAEVQNWLLVAHQTPRKEALLVQRIRRDLRRWLPGLVMLATHPRGPASTTAIKVLKVLASQAEETETILEIYEHLPRKSSALAQIAAGVCEILLDRLGRNTRSNDGTEAMLWNNLSERCQDDNRPTAALRCAETAVELCRDASSKIPAHQRIKVICLLTLGKRQAEHGMARKALAVVKKAWNLASALSRSGAIEDQRLEAQAATSCANRLAAVGELESGMKAAMHAIELLATFPDSPEVRYDRAMAELVMANLLTCCGRHEDSMPHADKAERAFRVLTGDEPDEYFEFAAAAANTYAQNLSHTGRLDLAYDLSLCSVKRMEEWARRQPTRFGHEFTTHLISLADCAGDLGRFDEAVLFAKQAVIEARKLGERLGQRDWYLEGVASSNQFNLLYRLQNFEEAEEAIRRAQRAFRRLPGSHPEARPELARSLRNQAEVLRMSASPAKTRRAVRLAGKAVQIMELKPAPKTESHRQLTSQCHTTLAVCLEEAGRLNEAISEERVSLTLRRKLFSSSKLVYRTDLAYSLFMLAGRLLKAGVPDEALCLAAESVGHYELALPTAPERTAAFMANALQTLAEIQFAKRQRKRGIKTLLRAIQLLRPRYLNSPAVWRASLLPLCTLYVERCGEVGQNFDESVVLNVITDSQR